MFALSLNNKVQVLTLNLRTNAFHLFLSFEDIFTLSYQGKRLMISGKAESMILWLCLFPPEWTYFSEPKYHYSTSGRLGENILDDKTAFFWHMSPLFHFRYASGQTYSWDTIFQIKVLCIIPQEIWCHASLNLRPRVHCSLPRICAHDFQELARISLNLHSNRIILKIAKGNNQKH